MKDFRYTQEWENELLYLAKKEHVTRKEDYEFMALYEMIDFSSDKRAIKVIMQILKLEDIFNGFSEGIFSTLSSTEYKAYFEAYFEILPELLNDEKNRWLAEAFLDRRRSGDEYTKEDLNTIRNMAKEYLSLENAEKLYNLIVEDLTHCHLTESDIKEERGSPYVTIFEYLKQFLKENGKL